jgi:hypothetical protein
VVRGIDVRHEAGTWLGPRCPKTGAKGDAPNRTHAAAGIGLAAALGKSVWGLVRFDSCWRWLTGRRDSPWYPALRLYRQSQAGDWETVVAKVLRPRRHADDGRRWRASDACGGGGIRQPA